VSDKIGYRYYNNNNNKTTTTYLLTGFAKAY